MPVPRASVEIRLVNGSTGDPSLYIDHPGRDNALLFDAGENAALETDRLADLGAVFLTHYHVDHFIGFDRIVRANIDRDKAVRVFGPEGTIRKVYNRIKSYEYPFFPFQKIVLEVNEIFPDRLRTARLECAQRFPRPVVTESAREGPVVYADGRRKVEAALVDHTVPCLSYAMVEAATVTPDRRRITNGPLAPGDWVGRVRELIQSGASPETEVATGDGPRPMGELADRYFTIRPGNRIAYVTDTAWSEAVRPALLRLARGASRLYCDSFYAHEQLAQAEKYRHMTATQTAEFAREAEVDQLILIHFSSRYEGRYEALVEEARAIFPRVSAELPVKNGRSGANPR